MEEAGVLLCSLFKSSLHSCNKYEDERTNRRIQFEAMRPLLHARTLRMTTVQELTDHLISQLILGDVISLEEREQVGLTVVQTVRDHLISSESPMETAGEKNLLHALLDIVPETMQLQSLLQPDHQITRSPGIPHQAPDHQVVENQMRSDLMSRVDNFTWSINFEH